MSLATTPNGVGGTTGLRVLSKCPKNRKHTPNIADSAMDEDPIRIHNVSAGSAKILEIRERDDSLQVENGGAQSELERRDNSIGARSIQRTGSGAEVSGNRICLSLVPSVIPLKHKTTKQQHNCQSPLYQSRRGRMRGWHHVLPVGG